MNHQFKILVTFEPAAIEIKKKYLKEKGIVVRI